LKGGGRGTIQELCRHLPGGTKEDRNISAGYAVFLPTVEPRTSRPKVYSFTTTSTSSLAGVVLRNTDDELCKLSSVVQLLNAACSYEPPQSSRDTPSTVSSHNLVPSSPRIKDMIPLPSWGPHDPFLSVFPIRILYTFLASPTQSTPDPSNTPPLLYLILQRLKLNHNIYTQGVPGGMCQNSGECSLS